MISPADSVHNCSVDLTRWLFARFASATSTWVHSMPRRPRQTSWIAVVSLDPPSHVLVFPTDFFLPPLTSRIPLWPLWSLFRPAFFSSISFVARQIVTSIFQHRSTRALRTYLHLSVWSLAPMGCILGMPLGRVRYHYDHARKKQRLWIFLLTAHIAQSWVVLLWG